MVESERMEPMKGKRNWRGGRPNMSAGAPAVVPGAADHLPHDTWRGTGLVAVKTIHTLAFFSIGSCLAYLLYSGVRKLSDRRAAIAAAVVTGEALIYAGNRMRCPLTGLAEKLGAERGSVSDIYLPQWIVARLAEITAPI
jgi:hypothetical protein